MKRTLLFCILLLSILLVANSFAQSPSNTSCSSISDLNMQNVTINNIKFADGKAYTSDSAELPGQCDWEHDISRDEILRPVADKEVRFIVMRSNHKTGSGAWDTIFIFDCLNGFMNKIFEKKYLYGVKIKKDAQDEFILTSGDRQPNDPMCCPSKEKHEKYRWSSSKNTYVIESTTTSKKKLK